MAAAQWTIKAKDITGDPDSWSNYLPIQRLSVLTGLSEATIRDTLYRRVTDPDEPRSAITQPAARIGPTRLNALPYWTQDQADEYLRLAKARRERPDTRKDLPRYARATATRAGLAGTRELAEHFGCAENTIRWWVRSQGDTFPPEVGIAAREEGHMHGAPLALRSIAAVTEWINADEERVTRLNASRAEIAARSGAPAA